MLLCISTQLLKGEQRLSWLPKGVCAPKSASVFTVDSKSTEFQGGRVKVPVIQKHS